MIVIGTDTHKQTHTCGAVFAGTGQVAGELTAPARKAGSTAPFTASRSPKAECTHPHGSSWPESEPRASQTEKRCAA